MYIIIVIILRFIYSSTIFNGNTAHTVANNLCIIFSSICLILYNNILMNFKQVNLPYTVSYFSQCATINQDFWVYHLKMPLVPSFIFYPISEIKATHVICLILSLVYVKTPHKHSHCNQLLQEYCQNPKNFPLTYACYYTFTGEKCYEVLSRCCLSLHIFMFAVPT